MNNIMEGSDIAFPGIGLYLKNVPKSFQVFGFQIALYGVLIGLGVLSGVFMAAHVAKKEKVDPDIIWDVIIYELIFSILGARIYYVIFEWDMYKDNLLEILNLRNGGLAIYGAVIAAFITLYVYCRIKKLSFLQIVDICVPGLILGQAIGRWGNFFNREVFGEYTNNFLVMCLPIDAVRIRDISVNVAAHIAEGTNYIQVHPTFLYECLWNLLILALMLIYRKYKKFNGEMWLLYMGGYGLGRFWIEAIRTDQLYVPGTRLPVSQLLAALFILVSAAADIFIRVRLKKAAPVETSVPAANDKEHAKNDTKEDE